ncbi:MAG: PhoH family protein [Alphaproteobacteria bacterium]|nr:PhoH family protein [Alphaproteobacteria bacterium]
MVLEMFANGEIDQMIISTPVDEGGEEIGFRKGDDREKMGPHINQILEAMDGHLGCGDFKKGKEIREELITAGVIEITSLGVISGRNLRRKALIVDEAHKAKMPHLLLCMSRIHTNGSKVVLMGDERQHISAGVSDFRDFTKIFADPAYAPYIAQITFSADDIRRHPMIKLMSERGDDIPPGLKKKMKEEQMTFEKKAALLKAHFEKSAKPGPKNILSDKLAQEIIRRFTPEEVFQMLEEQLHGAPGNDM